MELRPALHLCSTRTPSHALYLARWVCRMRPGFLHGEGRQKQALHNSVTHHVPVGNFTTPRWASEAKGWVDKTIKTRRAPTSALLGEASLGARAGHWWSRKHQALSERHAFALDLRHP